MSCNCNFSFFCISSFSCSLLEFFLEKLKAGRQAARYANDNVAADEGNGNDNDKDNDNKAAPAAAPLLLQLKPKLQLQLR